MSVLSRNSRLFRFGSALLVFVGLVFNNGLFWEITSRRPVSVHSHGQGKTAAEVLQSRPKIESESSGVGTGDSSAGEKKNGAFRPDGQPHESRTDG